MNASLEPLTSFILPSGSVAVATLHLARAIVRSAERAAVALNESRAAQSATDRLPQPPVGSSVRRCPPCRRERGRRCALATRRHARLTALKEHLANFRLYAAATSWQGRAHGQGGFGNRTGEIARAAVRHPQADARSRRAAQRRGRDDPAVPRCVAGQMAPRPYDLVFRDLRAARSRAAATARSTSAGRFSSTAITKAKARATRAPRRGMLSRPSLDEVRAYRAHVDEALDRRADWRFRRRRSSWSSSESITSSSTRSCSSPTFSRPSPRTRSSRLMASLPPPACFATEPLSFQPGREGIVEIGAADDGLRVRQRAAAPPRLP